MVNLEILWEDDDIMVVNKPPSVVVNRAESVREETVQDWVERHIVPANLSSSRTRIVIPAPEPESIQIDSHFRGNDSAIELGMTEQQREEALFVKRSGIAHRLDKETSGCLLIAKNPEALKSLLRQFRDRETKKEYLALVHGHLTPKEGTIRLPLSRSRFDRERWEIRYSGKMAETTWKVEKYFGETTLVRLFPKTGRTHQIRVHLAHLGYPIFSDEKYLTKSKVISDRERLPFHFLHAERIGFQDMRGEWQSVTAPLPGLAVKLLLLMESE